MVQENYEMTRSSIDQTFEEIEEEAQLLNKEDQEDEYNDDEDWLSLETEFDEVIDSKDIPLWRFVCIGISIGLFFLVFKVSMLALSSKPNHKDRAAEKLYNNGTDYFSSTVILVSLDGFEPDYLNRDITPNLNKLAKEGVRAKLMHPSFPPSSFPNHWTLVTGLYPESHGIVGNTFYDETIDREFDYKDSNSTSDKAWWLGQPIWITSKMYRRRSAALMWPGCNVKSLSADYVIPFDKSVGIKEKIDITLGWLDLPYNERPQTISVYIQNKESEGSDTSKINDEIKDIDDNFGYLLNQLKQRNLDQHVHIVIVSNHDMSQTSKSRLIYYDDILSKDVLKYLRQPEAEPLLGLRPVANAPKDIIEKAYLQLYNYTLSTLDPHFKPYLRESIPDKFHYKNSNRIAPLIAIPDIGYTFTTHKKIKAVAELESDTQYETDNLLNEVEAVFIARGPKVSRIHEPGTTLAPFYNVEVYSFLTELLNIEPSVNNGTLEGVLPALIES